MVDLTKSPRLHSPNQSPHATCPVMTPTALQCGVGTQGQYNRLGVKKALPDMQVDMVDMSPGPVKPTILGYVSASG
jgi:hypothetical protein